MKSLQKQHIVVVTLGTCLVLAIFLSGLFLFKNKTLAAEVAVLQENLSKEKLNTQTIEKNLADEISQKEQVTKEKTEKEKEADLKAKEAGEAQKKLNETNNKLSATHSELNMITDEKNRCIKDSGYLEMLSYRLDNILQGIDDTYLLYILWVNDNFVLEGNEPRYRQMQDVINYYSGQYDIIKEELRSR